MTKLFQDL